MGFGSLRGSTTTGVAGIRLCDDPRAQRREDMARQALLRGAFRGSGMEGTVGRAGGVRKAKPARTSQNFPSTHSGEYRVSGRSIAGAGLRPTGTGKYHDATKLALEVAQYNHAVLRRGRGSGNRGGSWTHKTRVGKWP